MPIHSIKPLTIGKTVVAPSFILAPMAGYTDSAFRSICMRFHCGMVFSEVANAESITRASKTTLHLFEALPEERPMAAHIYGKDPETMAKAAVIIEKLDRFDLIDINCGCPVRKIVAKGSGAALIKKPELIAKIISAVKEHVSLPVTIKTRTGYSPDRPNILEIAEAAEKAGASAISIHGRFATRGHNGPADWEMIAEVKKRISIPVIGNGGITTAEQAVETLERSGVDAVMIGRGAVGNPWIFQQIYDLINGRSAVTPSIEEKTPIIIEHINKLTKLKTLERKYRRKSSISADMASVLHFRSHLYRYLKEYPGWHEVRRNLQEVKTMDDVLKAVRTAYGKGLCLPM